MRFMLASLFALSLAVLGCTPVEAAQTPGTPITTQAELDAAIASSTVPVVVDFHADWCGPCQVQKPILKAVMDAHPAGVVVLTVDVDQAGALAQAYRVESIPTLIKFSGGQEADRKVGVTQQPELETWLGL